MKMNKKGSSGEKMEMQNETPEKRRKEEKEKLK